MKKHHSQRRKPAVAEKSRVRRKRPSVKRKPSAAEKLRVQLTGTKYEERPLPTLLQPEKVEAAQSKGQPPPDWPPVVIAPPQKKPSRNSKPAAWRSQHQILDLNEPLRLLSRPEVLDLVGVSYPTIWSWMQQGKFPRSRKLGDQKVGWLASELKSWIESRPIMRLKGDAPSATEVES